ncbi:MAG: tetratricopeptide repeat protein [Isosphaeraceae bacterium]|nr:tetratricopeptide repeat protein [Isosphaeraceae bacterium]
MTRTRTTGPPKRSDGSSLSLMVRASALVFALVVAVGVWFASQSEALREAENAYKRRNFVLALDRARAHLLRRPWSHSAAVLAGRALSEVDRADEAEGYYHRAEWTGPLDPDDQHTRAFGLLCAKEPDRAIAIYEEILRRRPRDTLALRRMAAIYYSRKQMRQATEIAEQLTHIPADALIGYAMIGSIRHDDRDPAGAIAAYEKVLELQPDLKSLPFDYSIFWNELTTDLIASGRAEDACRLLSAELQRRDDAILYYLRGLAEESLGVADAAEKSWLQAVERDPRSKQAWLSLGRLELKTQRPEPAIEHLTRALTIAPDDYETVYSLALAYRQLGRADEAEQYTKRADQIRAMMINAEGHANGKR